MGNKTKKQPQQQQSSSKHSRFGWEEGEEEEGRRTWSWKTKGETWGVSPSNTQNNKGRSYNSPFTFFAFCSKKHQRRKSQTRVGISVTTNWFWILVFMKTFLSSWVECHYSLLQQPLRRQTQTQMQQRSTNATKPAAPDIKIVIFRGSRRTWRSRGWSFMGQWNITCKHHWRVPLNHLQSMTFNCWATQLLGAPTLLEDSQRYIPESVLDTLFNFCSK